MDMLLTSSASITAKASGLIYHCCDAAVILETYKKYTTDRPGSSDTGNRTPGYRVRGDNVSHYTISDLLILLSKG
jgi:hypothetical protein